MRTFLISFSLLLCLSTYGLGQTTQATPVAPGQIDAKSNFIDVDNSVDPCTDFYQYACGNWMKSNPIPSDYPDWDSFGVVQEHNLHVLRQILEKASVDDAKRSPVIQKIGDFYTSCMDEKAANEKGYLPLGPELEHIAGIHNTAEMMVVLAAEHKLGSNALFNFSPGTDFHNSDLDIAFLDQSGLTLPDRDYYLKDDPDTVSVRKAYLDHMQKMFVLIGQTPAQASHSADAVLEIETKLAKASMDRTLRRDPKNLDHMMAVTSIETIAPNLHLKRYFAAVGAPAFTKLNVSAPDFIKTLNLLMLRTPLTTWKTYLTWQLLDAYASWLSDDFVQQDFKFRKVLSGQEELSPRWKRCVYATDGNLGEALAQPYVEETFGADGKQRTLKMVDAIEKALQADISTLPWMTEATRKEALLKLAAIRNKIGYPDQWRDYSKLEIVRDDLFGNLARASAFEENRQLQKIGKPVDRLEWGMTPPTVNAYYSGDHNEIVFPAGILQPPFFDREMDDAVNFGTIGLVIGHELTHGFDDEGRQYDAQGNLRDWWTPKDAQEFDKRASCIADEYGSFTAVDTLKLNGKLTLGENTADNGGAHLSYTALLSLMAETGQDPNKKIDGYTPAQRYFLGFARAWCQNITPELSRVLVRSDPHSPNRWRVDGVVQNMPEFQQAFGCKKGQPMVREPACRVW